MSSRKQVGNPLREKLRENMTSPSKRAKLADELFAPAVDRFRKRRILTKGIDDLWGCDLLDMSKYVNENKVPRTNTGYKFLLVVIDTFSKYLFLEPLQSKHGSRASQGFEKILKNSGRCPNLLHVDQGKEFFNKNFRAVCKNHGIDFYNTFSVQKSAICERVIRTINQKLSKHFERSGRHVWINFLPTLLNEYNTLNKHRSIGMTPSQVNKNNEDIVRGRLFPTPIRVIDKKPSFTTGQRVRISRLKPKFGNKYEPKWSREVFIITKINSTDPVTYNIKDLNNNEISGKFYEKELQKTDF